MFFNTRSTSPIGIDLGTANTIVVAAGNGIVFDQPTVCCFQGFDAAPRLIAAGEEASRYVGRISKPLKIVRPLRNGVLSDMRATRELLHFARRSIGKRRGLNLVQPIIGVPADATQSEQRALETAAVDAGFGSPKLVPEPLLAAIGAGVDVDQARGRMVVDCGAGTTEVAVISLGSICLSKSVRGGGDALDQALLDHLAFHHRFQIGEREAEKFKLRLSELFEAGETDAIVSVRGLDTATGLPQTLTLSAEECRPVWIKQVEQIGRAVRQALSETPPELSEDILEDGITLTGGGALAALLSRHIAEEAQVVTRIAQKPRHCVASGLQKLLLQ